MKRRQTLVLSLSHRSRTMPKAAGPRKGATLKHDPLAVQLRAGELDDSGVLSAPGKRQKTKKHHQQEEVRRTVPSIVSSPLIGFCFTRGRSMRRSPARCWQWRANSRMSSQTRIWRLSRQTLSEYHSRICLATR